MPLPAFPELTEGLLRHIAEHHGLKGMPIAPMPQVGTFNAVFAVGEEIILRVPRAHSRFTDAALNEAVAVPLAIAAGVSTPALLAFDASLQMLPVPYSFYERVVGVSLEQASRDPAQSSDVWKQLGRELAKLHGGVTATPMSADLIVFEDKTDPRPLPDAIATAGYFGSAEAAWLNQWLDRLAPVALASAPRYFLHGDSQATNVMVSNKGAFLAVIDWGSCLWGDIAFDFAGVPLRAVPALLSGYREIKETDETLEARILWRHLQIALHQLRGTPKPEQSWAERPLTILMDVLKFFTSTNDPRWKQWGPQV